MADTDIDITQPPEIVEKHSKSQILEELRLMIEPSGGLTAGGFLLLATCNPLFSGEGEVTEEAVEEALTLTKTTNLDDAFAVVQASFRCLECVRASDMRKLDYYTPEWLADLVGMASQSCNLTWREAVWGMPLAALVHLAMATYRRNGGKYERPKDYTDADKWLLQMTEAMKNGRQEADHYHQA